VQAFQRLRNPRVSPGRFGGTSPFGFAETPVKPKRVRNTKNLTCYPCRPKVVFGVKSSQQPPPLLDPEGGHNQLRIAQPGDLLGRQSPTWTKEPLQIVQPQQAPAVAPQPVHRR